MSDTSTKPPGYYDHARPDVAAHVPKGTKRLLDVGCGNGAFGAYCLKELGIPEVYGLDKEIDAYSSVRNRLTNAYGCDLDDWRGEITWGPFDCITFNDVLEHLKDHLDCLQWLTSEYLTDDGTVLISLPNARFFPVLYMHLKGHWHYEDAGVMDRTHLRFFCLPEMFQLVIDAGLEPQYAKPLAMMSVEQYEQMCLDCPDAGQLYYLACKDDGVGKEQNARDLLTVQYLLVAKKKGNNEQD